MVPVNDDVFPITSYRIHDLRLQLEHRVDFSRGRDFSVIFPPRALLLVNIHRHWQQKRLSPSWP